MLILSLTLCVSLASTRASAHEGHGSEPTAPKGPAAWADAEPLGVTERLGLSVDADAVLRDEEGKPVRFGDLLGVPTLLLPVYYACPDVCSFLQGNVAKILSKVDLEPGRDFQVISLSFDSRETPAMASQARRDYLSAAGEKWPPSAWRFLTGDEGDVARVMGSIGFRFERTEDQFVHSVVVVALAAGGKIVRYLYGYKPLPFDLTMAMTEASEGRVGFSVKRALSYCFSYDPKGKRYAINVMRISGAVVLLLAATLFLALALGGRRKRRRNAQGPP